MRLVWWMRLVGSTMVFTGFLLLLTSITLVAFGIWVRPEAAIAPALAVAWGAFLVLLSVMVDLLNNR